MYIRKLCQKAKQLSDKDIPTECSEIQIPEMVNGERYVVTSGYGYKASNGTKNVEELSCKPCNPEDADLKKALEYFYRKPTLELIKLAEKQSYKNITTTFCNTQEIGGNLSTSDVIMDLSASTFFVPLILISF